MKVTAIIERVHTGNYSIYTLEEFDGFGLFGYGDTVQEAKEDFFDAYKEFKEEMPEKVPEIGSHSNMTFPVSCKVSAKVWDYPACSKSQELTGNS
jgi:hypothetical protein